MSPFKFEVNWALNGVDMTSQTYTHFIWAHMRDLVWGSHYIITFASHTYIVPIVLADGLDAKELNGIIIATA